MRIADTVQNAIDYIEERLAEPLCLEAIGEAAAMSLPSLYRQFCALTGHSVKEYVRKRRTSEAAGLLRHSELPPIEIAYRCGFDSHRTFAKVFKRYTGLTPGLYRRAESVYSFERLRLQERYAYEEDRELSERYPDVKAIRLPPQRGIGYLHLADREEGLEEEAYRRFRNLLERQRIELGRLRVFGWNVGEEQGGDGSPSFGYQLMAVGAELLAAESAGQQLGSPGALEPNESNEPPGAPGSLEWLESPEPSGLEPPTTPGPSERPAPRGLRSIEHPGGAYAVAWTRMDSAARIVSAWNRMVSEWLPLSSFELGEHGFLEEYQTFNGRVSRLKLYLPVRRAAEIEAIEIVEREPRALLRFRAEGADSRQRADEAAMEWLGSGGLPAGSRPAVFMSGGWTAGRSPESEREWCEIGIAPPDGWHPSREEEEEEGLRGPEEGGYAGQRGLEEGRLSRLEGGLYAGMTTPALGSMTGVVERIYRWLAASADYEADESRSWFAQYERSGRDNDGAGAKLERMARVTTFVPVTLARMPKQEDER